MQKNFFIIILFFYLVFCSGLSPVFAAESPNTVGDFFQSLDGSSTVQNSDGAEGEVPQSLPGTEITPEDMQRFFPTPLGQDAPRMDFIPDAAPLFPVLPTKKTEKQNNIVETPLVKEPTSVPSPTLQMTAPSNNNQQQIPIKSIVEDQKKKPKENVEKQKIDINNPSLEQMVGQMVLAGFTGGELEKGSAILSLISEGKVGGVFLVPIPSLQGEVFEAPPPKTAQQENIFSPTQLRVLAATLQGSNVNDNLPLFIAIEHEGGLVQSLRSELGFAGLAAAARLGQGSVEQTEIAARKAGLEMAGLGINFALAPAGDTNLNPLNDDIGKRFRSFSPNPDQVAKHVQAFGNGLLAAGVVPCLLNFPGTGSRMGGFAAKTGSEQGQNLLFSIPDIGAFWQNKELIPYKKAIESGWSGAVQPAFAYHRGFDALRPVPLSQTLLDGVLRVKLGFNGLIVSQDLRRLQPMYSLDDAVIQSVLAGADLLLVTEPAHIMDTQAEQGLGGLENMLGGDALTKSLLQQGLGKAMPNLGFGGFGAQVSQKVQTGHADEAAKVYNILLGAVKNGRIPIEKIRASWRRILKTKQEFLVNDVK